MLRRWIDYAQERCDVGFQRHGVGLSDSWERRDVGPNVATLPVFMILHEHIDFSFFNPDSVQTLTLSLVLSYSILKTSSNLCLSTFGSFINLRTTLDPQYLGFTHCFSKLCMNGHISLPLVIQGRSLNIFASVGSI